MTTNRVLRRNDVSRSPYIEQPLIPEGMTVHEYRINRPRVRVSTFRRLVGYGVLR
jgi:hypothetical protein